MSSIPISLLDLEDDASSCLAAEDYQKKEGKWCAGCGDFGALNAVKRLLAKEQLQPEKMAFISGIGCSSRFPHYVNAYGFHGIHGRALPIATGLKLANPVMASSSPLTGSIDTLRQLEEAGVSAVVLPSLFEEQIEHGLGGIDPLPEGCGDVVETGPQRVEKCI